MLPTTVRVNTFLNENEKPHVDPISKIFIILEVVVGLGRIPLIFKRKLIYVFLSFTVFVVLNSTIIYWIVHENDHLPVNTVMMINITQNILCTLLSFTRCKLMLSFYSKLNKFDAESGCRPKISIGCIRNVVQASLLCILVVVTFVIPTEVNFTAFIPVHFIPVQLVYVLELHYYGHLLNLLTPRLKLINYYIETSLSGANINSRTVLKQFNHLKPYDFKAAQSQIRKQMDLYQIVVEAYDFLIEGIKWQLLLNIMTAFLSLLCLLFVFALHTIHAGGVLTNGAILGTLVVITMPLFAPCIFGDSVHNEVKKLKELIASRLYENKLDKSGRRIARALLSLAETRDLSFQLLRMLNIDISLPFKFVGLLIAYLVILLQFDKVINP